MFLELNISRPIVFAASPYGYEITGGSPLANLSDRRSRKESHGPRSRIWVQPPAGTWTGPLQPESLLRISHVGHVFKVSTSAATQLHLAVATHVIPETRISNPISPADKPNPKPPPRAFEMAARPFGTSANLRPMLGERKPAESYRVGCHRMVGWA